MAKNIRHAQCDEAGNIFIGIPVLAIDDMPVSANDYAALKAENERLQAMIAAALAIPDTEYPDSPTRSGLIEAGVNGEKYMRRKFREALGG